jgi:hypothetical protein
VTVAVCTPINSYIGNGSSNQFSFNFPVWNQNQITVTVVPTTPGTAYQLVPGTDFTVSGLNPAGTPAAQGSITLINAGQTWLNGNNLATGWVLTIVRTLALEQDTSIRNQGDYYRSSLEDALDYLTMLIQDQATGTFILTDQSTAQNYLMVMINGVFSQIPIAQT